MSLSNPTVKNPCTKFITFKGDKGIFEWYDKEKEKKTQLRLPCFFIVLDQLSTITGFHEGSNSGIYANEIHSLAKEELKVKSFKGNVSIVGKYTDIKGSIKEVGGKFTKSIYAMLFMKEENGSYSTELVNFQLCGSSFASWMNLKFDANSHCVGIEEDMLKESKGAIKYFMPVFKRYAMNKEVIAKVLPDAIKQDEELQQFFKDRKSQVMEEASEAHIPIHEEEETANEVLHRTNYEQDKHHAYGNPTIKAGDIQTDAPPPSVPEPEREEVDDDLPF